MRELDESFIGMLLGRISESAGHRLELGGELPLGESGDFAAIAVEESGGKAVATDAEERTLPLDEEAAADILSYIGALTESFGRGSRGKKGTDVTDQASLEPSETNALRIKARDLHEKFMQIPKGWLRAPESYWAEKVEPGPKLTWSKTLSVPEMMEMEVPKDKESACWSTIRPNISVKHIKFTETRLQVILDMSASFFYTVYDAEKFDEQFANDDDGEMSTTLVNGLCQLLGLGVTSALLDKLTAFAEKEIKAAAVHEMLDESFGRGSRGKKGGDVADQASLDKNIIISALRDRITSDVRLLGYRDGFDDYLCTDTNTMVLDEPIDLTGYYADIAAAKDRLDRMGSESDVDVFNDRWGLHVLLKSGLTINYIKCSRTKTDGFFCQLLPQGSKGYDRRILVNTPEGTSSHRLTRTPVPFHCFLSPMTDIAKDIWVMYLRSIADELDRMVEARGLTESFGRGTRGKKGTDAVDRTMDAALNDWNVLWELFKEIKDFIAEKGVDAGHNRQALILPNIDNIDMSDVVEWLLKEYDQVKKEFVKNFLFKKVGLLVWYKDPEATKFKCPCIFFAGQTGNLRGSSIFLKENQFGIEKGAYTSNIQFWYEDLPDDKKERVSVSIPYQYFSILLERFKERFS